MANLNVLMSIGTILLLVYWFVHPGWKRGLSLLAANKVAMAMAGLYLIHVVWMFNTEDFDFAVKDLRIKLPLLVFALVLGGSEISKTQVKYVFVALAAGVWVAITKAYANYFSSEIDFYDFRNIVDGISHIRLSLMMVLVMAGIFYYWKEMQLSLKILSVLTFVNILIFFNLIQSASGVAVLACIVVYTLLHTSYQKAGGRGLAAGFALIALLLVGSGFWLNQYYQQYFTSSQDIGSLPDTTAMGNLYTHHTESMQVENGQYTYLYLSEVEMEEAWDERSGITMKGDDKVMERATLVRYLTSKGLTKDRAGVMALTEEDIANIENGLPSIVYTQKKGLSLRLHTTLFGYHQYLVTKNAGGSSLFQRLVYWNAAYELITRNFWLGTGTGDVKMAFENIYDEIEVNLEQKFRLRAHNQYLTFWVSFGLLGIIYFISLFALPFTQGRISYLYTAFLLIAAISCLTEDTLETQAGVTFFAFFYGLFSVASRTKRTGLD